jgi:hypothetical protein
VGDVILSPLEERVLRTLRDSGHVFLTIYQLAVELDDHAIGELQSATRLLKRRLLVTGDDERGWGITGIGETHLAQLAISRARR